MKYLIQGNFHTFNVTLTQNDGTTTTPYIPTENDKILINLNTANKQFQYKDFSQSQNVLTFTDNGCLSVGVYQLEVKIIDRSSHKLRCMYRDQLMVVASNDDIPLAESFDIDDINLGAEISISPQIVVDDELSLTSENPVQNKVVTAALNTKGDALSSQQTPAGYEVALKQGNTELSTIYIPFADAQESGLMTSNDFTKLDGIEAQANKTVVDSSLSSSSENPVQNKVVTAALDRKVGYLYCYEDLETGFDKLVIRIFGQSDEDNTDVTECVLGCVGDGGPNSEFSSVGLMHIEDKNKLDGIEAQANKTVVDNYLSSSSENPVQNKVVTAALKTKYDEFYKDILPDAIDFYFLADGEYVANWYIESATTTAAGLMSAADKTKLNGIEAQANKTVVDTSFDTTSTNPISNSAVALALGDIETILDNILGN